MFTAPDTVTADDRAWLDAELAAADAFPLDWDAVADWDAVREDSLDWF